MRLSRRSRHCLSSAVSSWHWPTLRTRFNANGDSPFVALPRRGFSLEHLPRARRYFRASLATRFGPRPSSGFREAPGTSEGPSSAHGVAARESGLGGGEEDPEAAAKPCFP